MKNTVYFICLIFLISNIIKGQCKTRIHIDLAKKVFNGQLTKSDFSKDNLFITIDTINSTDFNGFVVYSEQKDPEEIIKMFYNVMNNINLEGSFFNYYELIDCVFYPSPLHQSYLVNNAEVTFKVDIWNNKDDIAKIDGLTIQKYTIKFPPTPY